MFIIRLRAVTVGEEMEPRRVERGEEKEFGVSRAELRLVDRVYASRLKLHTILRPSVSKEDEGSVIDAQYEPGRYNSFGEREAYQHNQAPHLPIQEQYLAGSSEHESFPFCQLLADKPCRRVQAVLVAWYRNAFLYEESSKLEAAGRY